MPLVVPAVTCHPNDLLNCLPEDVPDRRWWVACTMPRQEKSLARDLFQRRIPFYLPLLPKRLLYKGRSAKSYLPLFSGFVFLYADEQERLTALETGRITSILEVTEQAELQRDLAQIEQTLQHTAQQAELGLGDDSHMHANHGHADRQCSEGNGRMYEGSERRLVLSLGFLGQTVLLENGRVKTGGVKSKAVSARN